MATPRNIRFELDPWLAGVLKRPAYRWTGPVRGRPRFCGPGFYQAKMETSKIAALKGWIKAGFQMVDILVTGERIPSHQTAPGKCGTRLFHPKDAASLRSWGGTGFVCSRFHMDPELSYREAGRIKQAWVKGILSGSRADRVWVGLWKGRVVGFLARRQFLEGGQRIGILDLMAVESRARGNGVGDSLVRRYIRDSAADCDVLRVGTQAANVPSLRLYQRCGFETVRSQFVLHAHRKGEKG